jgi:two-component system response regulator HupR/HoxA
VLADEFDVVSTASALAAERELLSGSFEVVVSDYDMPGETGLDLLQRLQKIDAGLIGMLLTGHGEYAEVVAAKRDHVIFRVLLKPYDPEMLVVSIRTAISLARMRATTLRLANTGSM